MDLKLPTELLERWEKLSRNKPQNDTSWDKVKWAEGISDRGKEVMDRNPSFLSDLIYIMSGLKDGDVRINEPDTGKALESTKPSAKLKDKMLRKFSAEEIKGLCRSRYSLMTLEDFLLILNRMNSASSGNLLKDK